MQQAQSFKIAELSTIHLAMNSSLASGLLDISGKKYVQDRMLSMSFLNVLHRSVNKETQEVRQRA